MEDQLLIELLELFSKIECRGSREDRSLLWHEDNDALKIFRKTIRHNSERYEIVFPGKSVAFCWTNITLLLISCSAWRKDCCSAWRIGNNLTLKEKYDQTLSTDFSKNYKNESKWQNLNLRKYGTCFIIRFKIQKSGTNSMDGKCRFKVSKTVIV